MGPTVTRPRTRSCSGANPANRRERSRVFRIPGPQIDRFPIVNVAASVRIVDGAVVDAVVCAGARANALRLYAAESVLVGSPGAREICERACLGGGRIYPCPRKNAYKRQYSSARQAIAGRGRRSSRGPDDSGNRPCS